MRAATEEDDMQLGVEQALGYGGWWWHHDEHATLPSGTYAVSHSGQTGWPDIVAIHPQRRQLLVLELKSADGRYRPGQEDWLDAWRAVGADVRVVRPGDLHALEDELLGDRMVGRKSGPGISPLPPPNPTLMHGGHE